MDPSHGSPTNYKTWWRMPSVRWLILTNAIVIVTAVIEKWSLSTILMTYWFQSVIIGLFQAKKILDLKTFSTKGLKMNGLSVAPTTSMKRFIVGFFLMHYGFFHFVYFIFLMVFIFITRNANWTAIMLGSTAFFVNHLLSYRSNREQDAKRTQNIGSMMAYPYARILPMHLFIVGGGALIHSGFSYAGYTFALVSFLLLKTVADVYMHLVEHRYVSFGKGQKISIQ